MANRVYLTIKTRDVEAETLKFYQLFVRILLDFKFVYSILSTVGVGFTSIPFLNVAASSQILYLC